LVDFGISWFGGYACREDAAFTVLLNVMVPLRDAGAGLDKAEDFMDCVPRVLAEDDCRNSFRGSTFDCLTVSSFATEDMVCRVTWSCFAFFGAMLLFPSPASVISF
jgi:hypothetical protein